MSLPSFKHKFELVRWIVFVFIGGAINAAVIQAYGDFLLQIPKIFGRPLANEGERILYAWLPLVLLFLTPIILSIVLTTFQPEKQIVPPFWIQLVSFAWYAGFAFISYNSEFLSLLGVYGVYALAVGYAQTQITTPLLGIAADRDNILPFSLRVDGDYETIAEIFSINEHWKTLDFWNSGEETDEGRTVFRGESKNPNGTRFKIVLEVKKEPDTKLAQTELNLAFYERTLYYLSPISKALREYASEKVGYVKNLLQKPEYGYTVTDSDLTKANGLVNALLRRMEGLIPKLVGLAPLGLVKVGAFTIILSLIAYYMFILQDTQLAIGIILSILFYLAFQLPSAVRRK